MFEYAVTVKTDGLVDYEIFRGIVSGDDMSCAMDELIEFYYKYKIISISLIDTGSNVLSIRDYDLLEKLRKEVLHNG